MLHEKYPEMYIESINTTISTGSVPIQQVLIIWNGQKYVQGWSVYLASLWWLYF